MNKLQQIRKENGYTQEEIAKILNISQQSYAKYEKDYENLPYNIVKQLCDIFEIDEQTFLYNSKMESDTITEFLFKSLNSYFAVKNSKEILEKAGFIELKENENWNIENQGKYYVTKNNSSILAFVIGNKDNFAFNIASSHTDQPSLKIKGNSLLNSPEGKRINVEKYGGPINYSFMDIPLKISGRVFVKNKNIIEEKLICSDFNVNIPSLCIHHNPNVNSGTELNNQNDMLPLIGNCENLYKKLLPNEEIIDSDLFCVPFVKPAFSGANNEFLVSARIDNLTSLYSSIEALISSKSSGISVVYASDNEEIGSLTKQGAESNFLLFCLERIAKSLGKTKEEFYIAMSKGFNLSIDNGHAIHPAHPEKSDPDQQVFLNKGIVIKHHTNYSTDGLSSAIVKQIAAKCDVKIQEYYNKSDVRCGSTIGNVESAKMSMNSCDIGLAQLAMHSGIETVGKHDIKEMQKLITCFFETTIKISENSIEIL